MSKQINDFVLDYEEKVKSIALAALSSLVSTPNATSVQFTCTISFNDDGANLKLESVINQEKPE